MSYFYVFLFSILPISELRGAIPLGILEFHLPWQTVFLIAVTGNICGMILAWVILKYLIKLILHYFSFGQKVFDWMWQRTERKNKKKFQILGDLALLTFVAIPLPFTGAWTGVLASFIFKIPSRRALPIISLGILIAGIIVELSVLGLIKII